MASAASPVSITSVRIWGGERRSRKRGGERDHRQDLGLLQRSVHQLQLWKMKNAPSPMKAKPSR